MVVPREFLRRSKGIKLSLLLLLGFVAAGALCSSTNKEALVANSGGNSILGYRFDARNHVVSPPDRVIGGGSAGGAGARLNHPIALALDGSENIYAVNLGDDSGGPGITVHDAKARGNTAPVRTIPGDAAGLVKPTGIAIRQNPASILVSNRVDPPDPSRPPGILEFSMTPGRNAPTGRISGPATTISAPGGVALDAAQRVYVSEPETNRILMFEARPNTEWNGAPSGVLNGPLTLLNRPSGMAFDAKGNLYVANTGNSSITVYAADSKGNVAMGNAPPDRRISGVATRLNRPVAIAMDRNFRIFVTQNNEFLVFGKNATGSGAPESVIADSGPGGSFGIAIR